MVEVVGAHMPHSYTGTLTDTGDSTDPVLWTPAYASHPSCLLFSTTPRMVMTVSPPPLLFLVLPPCCCCTTTCSVPQHVVRSNDPSAAHLPLQKTKGASVPSGWYYLPSALHATHSIRPKHTPPPLSSCQTISPYQRCVGACGWWTTPKRERTRDIPVDGCIVLLVVCSPTCVPWRR